jgi:hypothetical protein
MKMPEGCNYSTKIMETKAGIIRFDSIYGKAGK